MLIYDATSCILRVKRSLTFPICRATFKVTRKCWIRTDKCLKKVLLKVILRCDVYFRSLCVRLSATFHLYILPYTLNINNHNNRVKPACCGTRIKRRIIPSETSLVSWIQNEKSQKLGLPLINGNGLMQKCKRNRK